MDTSRHSPDDYTMFRFWSNIVPEGDCWRWAGALDRDGYAERIKMRGVRHRPHRFAWELAHGALPDGLICCHTCRLRSCVNPKHVYAGTYKDNTADAIRDGTARCLHSVPTALRGEEQWAAVLTEADVRAIRLARAGGETVKALMARYAVGESQVYRIVKRQSWAHLV